MADIGEMWGAIPHREAMRINTPIGSICRLGGLSQHVVSGNLAAAAAIAGVDASGVGVLGLARGDAYSVRLARDRLMIVASKEGVFEPGWSTASIAVTDVSALDVFEIDGALADELISRATTPPLSGPSACVIFARVNASLYRCREGEAVRLHIDPSLTPYFWNWCTTVLPMICDQPTSSENEHEPKIDFVDDRLSSTSAVSSGGSV